jgi:hypothetical protein
VEDNIAFMIGVSEEYDPEGVLSEVEEDWISVGSGLREIWTRCHDRGEENAQCPMYTYLWCSDSLVREAVSGRIGRVVS